MTTNKIIWRPRQEDCAELNGFYHYGRTASSKDFRTGSNGDAAACWRSGVVQTSSTNPRNKYRGNRGASMACVLRPEYANTPYPIRAAFTYAEPVALMYNVPSKRTFGEVWTDEIRVESVYKFSSTSQGHNREFGFSWALSGRDNIININSPISNHTPQDWLDQVGYDVVQHLTNASKSRAPATLNNQLKYAHLWYMQAVKLDHYFEVNTEAAYKEMTEALSELISNKKFMAKLVKYRLQGHDMSEITQLTNALGVK